MSKNIEKIKLISDEQLYDVLTLLINDLYIEYNYLDLNKEYYIKEVKNIIKKNNTSQKDDYVSYFHKKIISFFNDYIKNNLSNDKSCFKIINNYINTKIKYQKSYYSALEAIKKLIHFFRSIEYFPNEDIIVELINANHLLRDLLLKIMDENIASEANTTQNKELSSLLKDDIFILFVETFSVVCDNEDYQVSTEEDIEKIYAHSKESDYSQDIVKAYIKEISKPLLTIEEEKNLILEISKGNKQAREILIERNLRLVVNIAKKYLGNGLDFIDLIQEGNIGLIKALSKYDSDKGTKFSTYAVYWIKETISKAVKKKGRNIRLPFDISTKLWKYNRTVAILKKQLDHEPTINEISEFSNLSIKEIEKLKKLAVDTVSINLLVGDGDEELGSFIPDIKQNTKDEAINGVFKMEVRQLLDKCDLTETEKNVLIVKYGFLDNQPKTLREVGEIMNISRSRVGQIEARAINKIRNSDYIEEFAISMENPTEVLKQIKTFKTQYNSSDKYKRNLPVENNLKETKQEKERIKMGKKPKTIYEYFSEYSKDEVDKIILSLTEQERNLIKLRYGDNLEKVAPTTDMSEKDYNKFYGNLIPKMKRLLSKLNQNNNNSKDLNVDKDLTVIKDKNDSIPFVSQNETVDDERNIVKSEELKPLDELINQQETNLNENPLEENQGKIIDILNIIDRNQILENFNIKEKIVVCLKLGYVDGKYYETAKIADFLEMSETEVREITKKALLLCKMQINEIVDKVIDVTLDNKNNLVKGKNKF